MTSENWLESSDMVTVHLTEQDRATAALFAAAAQTNGRSNVVSDHSVRVLRGTEDQLVGQMSTLAGHLWLYGTTSLYCQDRELQNRHPEKGDGGSDVGAFSNIDFKGSCIRKNPDPLSYNLLVRPKEFHEGWTYILCMVDTEVVWQKKWGTVYLVGWATSEMLKSRRQSAEPFCGDGEVYAMPARKLWPLPPFRWGHREELVREWAHKEILQASLGGSPKC